VMSEAGGVVEVPVREKDRPLGNGVLRRASEIQENAQPGQL
jgi:hypothetical protein